MRYNLACWLWGQEITDDLIEPLIRIFTALARPPSGASSARLIGTLKRVAGKNTLSYQLAETAAFIHPDGILREVLFTVVDEQNLANFGFWAKSGATIALYSRRPFKEAPIAVGSL